MKHTKTRPPVIKKPLQPFDIPSPEMLFHRARRAKPNAVIQATGHMLNIAGAAVFMGQDERWLRLRVDRKTIPHRRYGGRIYFVKDELIQFLHGLPGVGVTEARKNLNRFSGDDE